MTQLVVQLKNEKKAKMLSEFLSELTFVNSVELSEDKTPTIENEDEFFSFAGLWQDRDVTIESIRQKAWPKRNS